MTTAITASNITMKHINGFLTSEKNLRDKLQTIIVACAGHAQQHNNDFSLLSSLVSGLKERKTRNLQAITDYIQKHVEGIQWTNLGKKGKMGYKTIKGATVVYNEFEYPWFNHKLNLATNSVRKVDVHKRAVALMTQLKQALSGENNQTVDDSQREEAERIVGALEGALS